MCNLSRSILARNERPINRTISRCFGTLSLLLMLWPVSAFAVAVGGTVVNPATGLTETVVQVLGDGTVLTDQDNAILTRVAIGDKYTFDGKEYAIESVTKNPAGRVISIKLKEVGGTEVVDRETYAPLMDPGGGTGGITPGNAGGPVAVSIPSGNTNVVHDHQVGPRGSDGRNGYGVGVCIGFGKFKTCFVVGRSGHSGDPGGNGPTIDRLITAANNGNIQTISPGIAGITVISHGGDGGNGGNAYGALPSKNGGAAGLGGSVSVNSSVEISTSGSGAHGIFAQSRGGRGGNGGSGYIFSGSGAGGPASAGGPVTVINTGKILTTGANAIGIFAQSIGGGGGSSGDSYGIVGDVNSGSVGGNGNTVSVTNAGNIETRGANAHGIQAQSVGGTGGNSGNAGGIVALGGTSAGAGGGTGGSVYINNNTGGTILTKSDGSVGIFAQSVGGGGGSGGVSVGIVAFGSKGSRGGNGGYVDVRTQTGSSVQTEGVSGHGIFAQSVGGGGGTGGTGGGFAALGGDGNTAGNGGQIMVVNHGLVITKNAEAKGIYAQSIGGGGGSAAGTGGVVSLGGRGGAGGNGNSVNVQNFGGVQTWAIGSDAIFAQSIGGGGGSGAASGGIVALGGAGTQGGAGSTVQVHNEGVLETHGNKARGIFAQSIGGGGGAGGDGGGLVSIGGSGGIASHGGTVIVGNTGQIETSGNTSHGIQLQSIGGGGGDGGSSGGVVSIGGGGGAGGNGGVVVATNHGSIATQGNDANGIFAQSVGGGGGNGGSAIAVGAFVSVGLGGSAGNGGTGGTTTVNLGPRTVVIDGTPTNVDPLIATRGDRSNGILAQSVGGGGGNGGFSTSVSAGAFGSVSVGIGGRGGSGGVGGEVQINGNGAITTQGLASDGILAQSVGGGGGNGGATTSVALSAGSGASVSASLGIGGSGGGGGAGGRVQVRSGGSITTDGAMSTGLIAQSVGGGGGNGGFSFSLSGAASDTAAVGVAVGVGGTGGSGGAAGTVDAHYAGNITTKQTDSTGVLLQAVGGSGGNGGFNVSGAVTGSGAASGAITTGVGGSGGGGGSGGVVIGNVSGTVRTEADRSNGIVAQSVGGGGGNGAFNVSGSLAGAGVGAGAVSVGVGGSGGGAGHGSTVDLDVVATTTTIGEDSDGIVAQSIGGGGGNGGFNVSGSVAGAGKGAGAASVGVGGSGGSGGAGGIVYLDVTGNVSTQKRGSDGVVAQSLGGGGGNGGFNVSGNLAGSGIGTGAVSVGIGGSGGNGGSANTVLAQTIGQIYTEGDNANGLLAQSVGGGGGNGGFDISGSLTAAGTGSGAVSVGVGGSGGTGGNGGFATAHHTGNIITKGASSNAFINQSIGGGGGNGGFNVSSTLSASAGAGAASVGVGVGGFGGGGGAGSTAISNIIGDISTDGKGANGVLVQSVGGGGGNGAFNVTAGLALSSGGAATVGAGVGGFGGGGGQAGAATLNVTGNVVTSKDNAYGALVQSLGGSGGNGGLNVTGSMAMSTGNSGSIGLGIGGFGGGGGNSQKVDGKVDGAVQTSGANSFGVMAQSVGGGGGNGGANVSGSVNLSTKASGTASVGIGGFGGTGGAGGEVDYTRTGNTVTTGILSDAVTFQSIGGGGGNGAINISSGIAGTTTGTSAAVNIGIGGFGGTGGTAGNVKGRVTGDVIATGENIAVDTAPGAAALLLAQGSNGVVAQSVGGGGGNGGINISGGLALGSPSGGGNYSVTLALGGYGGAGGNAGNVDLSVLAERTETAGVVTAQGIIAAHGFGKSAFLAQSVGRGGGNGAINVAGGIRIDGGIATGIGGSGGAAGQGNNVVATGTGDIIASGARSKGFVAQSIGGGGGNGAINVAGGIQANKKLTKPSFAFGLGGAGGGTNVSGTVIATQSGAVSVTGVEAIGVLAQSVAGGGGTGGLNVTADLAAGTGYNAVIGIGGNGGTAANSKMVTLNSDGAVTVDGTRYSNSPVENVPLIEAGVDFTDRANGILVQSIGGGGGSGGLNVAGAISRGGSPLTAGVGGSGGAGGDAGAVLLNRGQTKQGLLQTYGNNATAMTAQSIGGGGGDAGINIVLAISNAGPTTNQSLILAVGGSGGAAGNASQVTVNQKGEIKTSGDHSIGLLAQSIGGGGGNANFNIGAGTNKDALALNLAVGGGTGDGGIGGNVTVDQLGDIMTAGLGSSAIVAQSIGGGGGNTSLSLPINPRTSKTLSISLGRTGGTGGAAGTVTVTANGMFVTSGDLASAIVAQSVGNGGGRSSATTVSVESQSGSDSTKSSSALQLAVGLDGGDGGSGGKVIVTAAGIISTGGKSANGIHAQSVGGGGGVGGDVYNIVLRESASAKVAIGGTGGSGAKSNTVDVTSAADITTNKENSNGIYAQSIGGAGGTGGKAVTLAPLVTGAASNGSTTVTVGVGGSGGTGAEAEKVMVASSGTIETRADQSAGIAAQSIGGGGGDGGLVFNQTVTGGQASKAVNLSIGGSGGAGGLSRAVTVENTGNIKTAGKRSYGIHAQSIGGGGGNGGLVASTIMSKASGGAATTRLDVSIGGSGGTGASSGDVSVTNGAAARIDTNGEDAHGILAQAIGGGGGNGSSIFTQNIARGQDSLLAGFSLGGSGGSGSKSGNVSVTNNGAIQTLGKQSHGIFAQSIGGGGGNGGTSIAMNAVLAKDPTRISPLLAVGGRGGSGEDAGNVSVNNTGTIRTEGKNSYGILAQSIGGGGGNAALGLNVGTSASVTVVANTLSALVGGLGGGSGGKGGKVTVTHSGDITVTGEGSQAIKAQSINGGGGGLIMDLNGISSLRAGSILPIGGGATSTSSKPTLEIIAGGSGTENTAAEAVSVTTTGTFGLTGNHNSGSSIQAIGGGGGTTLTQLVLEEAVGQDTEALEIRSTLGGENGKTNNGAAITGGHAGILFALGADSQGAMLQSIGGGGGRSILTVDATNGELGPSILKLGSTNGTAEAGATITYRIDDTIMIIGDQSTGVLAQSIGGGGGYQTFDTTPPETASAAMAPAPAIQATGFAIARFAAPPVAPPPVNVVLGSDGGAGNHGGAIDLTRVGNTLISGDNASAIVHQSIGAGGGVEQVSAGLSMLDILLGGQSSANGNGDTVTLSNSGMVLTEGSRSHGIVLQSVGGGGGAVFHDATANQVSNALSAANSGDGGAVQLLQTGDMETSGKESFGILLQSIGGGGGFIDGVFAGTAGGAGAGGTVDLTVDGEVKTFHETSTAVLAQSTGTSGGDISITLSAGGIIMGGAQGVGIDLRKGADNTITNDGIITTTAFVKGLALSGTSGNDTVENNDLITGNVKLAGGANAFNNNVDTARFNMGQTVDLGLASNRLYNNGTIELGNTGKIETVSTTELGGTFEQTASANMETDFDFVAGNVKVGKIDRINATGSASLDGTLDLLVVNPNAAAPGTHEVTFFTTQQDMTLQDLTLNAPVSAVAMYDILYPSLKEAKFEYVVDFSPVGLNGNQTSFGDYINNVQLAGGSSTFADLVGAIFLIETLDNLKIAYDSLSPEPYADNLTTTVTSIGDFNSAMMSCHNKDGLDRFVSEGNCLWALVATSEQEYAGNTENFAFNEQSYRFAGGAQGDFAENMYLGLAGSFEHTSVSSGLNATGDGQRPQAGVVLKYINDGTKIAGSLIGGLGTYDTNRVVNISNLGGVTSAVQKVGYVSSHVKLSQLYSFGDTYLLPSIDGSATYMHQRAFTETGGGLTNLTLDKRTQVYGAIATSIEAGGELDFANSVLRVRAKIGLLNYLGETPSVAASLVGTPAGVPSAVIHSGRDDTLLTLDAGLDWILDNGVNLRVGVGGQFGKDTKNRQGSLKLTIPM